MAPAADAAADTTATTTCTEDDEDASDAGASSSSPVGGGGGGGGGSGGGGMSGSQRELVDIMQQVKTKHLTVDEAEACFYDWKARHEHGFSRSFRQKQVGPAALRRSFGDVRKASSPPGALSRTLEFEKRHTQYPQKPQYPNNDFWNSLNCFSGNVSVNSAFSKSNRLGLGA